MHNEYKLGQLSQGRPFRFKDNSHIYWAGPHLDGDFVLVYSYEKHFVMRRCGTHYHRNTVVDAINIEKDRRDW